MPPTASGSSSSAVSLQRRAHAAALAGDRNALVACIDPAKTCSLGWWRGQRAGKPADLVDPATGDTLIHAAVRGVAPDSTSASLVRELAFGSEALNAVGPHVVNFLLSTPLHLALAERRVAAAEVCGRMCGGGPFVPLPAPTAAGPFPWKLSTTPPPAASGRAPAHAAPETPPAPIVKASSRELRFPRCSQALFFVSAQADERCFTSEFPPQVLLDWAAARPAVSEASALAFLNAADIHGFTALDYAADMAHWRLAVRWVGFSDGWEHSVPLHTASAVARACDRRCLHRTLAVRRSALAAPPEPRTTKSFT